MYGDQLAEIIWTHKFLVIVASDYDESKLEWVWSEFEVITCEVTSTTSLFLSTRMNDHEKLINCGQKRFLEVACSKINPKMRRVQLFKTLSFLGTQVTFQWVPNRVVSVGAKQGHSLMGQLSVQEDEVTWLILTPRQEDPRNQSIGSRSDCLWPRSMGCAINRRAVERQQGWVVLGPPRSGTPGR